MILLDTCVLSEAVRPRPDGRVLAWLDAMDENSLYLSVLVLGELYRGIELLGECEKRNALRLWFEELRGRFSGRILALDEGTLMVWGGLGARLTKEGTPVHAMDSLMAAAALRNNALLATRNTQDYAPTGVHLYNPWDYGR